MAIFSGHVCPPEPWRGVAEKASVPRWPSAASVGTGRGSCWRKPGAKGELGRTTILTSIKGYRMLLLEVMCYFKNHSAIVS